MIILLIGLFLYLFRRNVRQAFCLNRLSLTALNSFCCSQKQGKRERTTHRPVLLDALLCDSARAGDNFAKQCFIRERQRPDKICSQANVTRCSRMDCLLSRYLFNCFFFFGAVRELTDALMTARLLLAASLSLWDT